MESSALIIIEWFNGNLFDSNDAVPLESGDIQELLSVATLDWSEIEPSIFGTLFERGLDPSKRAQIGAHYTDPQAIMRIVEPVIVAPLRAEWSSAKEGIERRMAKLNRMSDSASKSRVRRQAQDIFHAYLLRLAEFKVLDPACGSGNFLYLALQALKDIEHQATLEAEHMGLETSFPAMHVGVHCVRGIELNSYAAELARVTVWIGEIQWMIRHGIPPSKNPILKPLETIECRDALIDSDGKDSSWPKADVIIGNPPFLGNKRMLSELGDEYTASLRRLFANRLSGGVDLVTYWFERSRIQIESNKTERVGLVATQAIRKGASRKVLDRIFSTTPIFEAWQDEPWINEGAAVRVSLVAFGRGAVRRCVNGNEVHGIQSDLTAQSGADLTRANVIPGNRGICFMGTSKVGPFEIPGDVAREWLSLPNPRGVSNADVLQPWSNGRDLTGRPSDTWIIDFGPDMPLSRAALYQEPFAHIRKHVKPVRADQRRDAYRNRWWIHAEARPGLRRALQPLKRFIATPRVAKHRFFVWLPTSVLPDSRLFAICRDDDFTFGVLSSRMHTVWATANASRHGVGNDPTYNASDCFETFPFPTATPEVRATIADAARALHELRNSWLNPTEWAQELSSAAGRYPSRFIPIPGHEADLKERTLTNLYNAQPTWLENAHAELDHAVATAYGWTDYVPSLPNSAVVARLLALNLQLAPDLFTTPSMTAGTEPRKPQTPDRAQDQVRSSKPGAEVLDRRLAVVCTLINRMADDRHFGRTKMAKLFFLADATQNLDLGTTYFREAAGPLDTSALYNKSTGLEALAVRRGWIQVREGKQVKYTRGEKLNEGIRTARDILGNQRTALNKLIDLFRKLNTEQCEIVATLYACWNDRLLDGKDASDESIMDEFLNEWHEKKRRFQRARLAKALQWMKDKGLVPTGRGSHTRSRRPVNA